jgi:hypothetical protein
MKFSKLDEMEVMSLAEHACFLIREALTRMPGRRSSREKDEAKVIALQGLLVSAVMARHKLGNPSENVVVSSSLNRRLFDAVDDWEKQHAPK